MNMPRLDDDIAALGANRTNSILPTLALRLAEEAKAGNVEADQANNLFERYYTAGGKLKIDTHTSSFRVQASKLRTIIKAKDPVLLKQVADIHGKSDGNRRSLYDAMVAASRWLVTRGTRPSARTLKEMVIKK
jgi:hypothetical protein